MATAIKSQGKTSFEKEVLNDDPGGTSKDVNEAWTAGGMRGVISHALVSQVRKRLGLFDNQQAKTGKPAKRKAASKVTKPARKNAATRSPNQPP